MTPLVAFATVLLASAPAGQYTLAVDTVTDTKTTLVWQRATAPGTYTWPLALQYCEGLTLGGQTDWRLPTIKELHSIVETRATAPKIDPVAFPSTPNNAFWSSTPFGGTGYAMYVVFGTGTNSYGPVTAAYAVRCVRGG